MFSEPSAPRRSRARRRTQWRIGASDTFRRGPGSGYLVATLRRLRQRGTGPEWVRIGKQVRYTGPRAQPNPASGS